MFFNVQTLILGLSERYYFLLNQCAVVQPGQKIDLITQIWTSTLVDLGTFEFQEQAN